MLSSCFLSLKKKYIYIILLVNESIKYYSLLTAESKNGPFKLTAMKIWEFIYNIKEYYLCGPHLNPQHPNDTHTHTHTHTQEYYAKGIHVNMCI